MDSQLPPATVDLYVPSPDERTMATLAHALQMLGGWIAPLIIFFTKRESKFVSFHALQVLLFQMFYLAAVMVFGAIFFVVMFASIFGTVAAQGHSSQPPFALFVIFPFFWLAMMAGGVLTLIMAIVYALKANRGEWAEIPVVGKWAKHILHI
ncbi:hypothetical protein Acid345_1370 [Candidatus Koribacter versatilis Ellin345]|uniref:DUF4870 domain-containing protein n=1 Tax=Koribacter versatilis (strain Ellin345) TaxID=204669 RepID=Q1IRX8_KORVE|nr:DUF4870 domain-containing protein [Candidatus Koribacter versatilis]ABF40372.1 hypothetical protein Acid345_1370 [Candidatus Koribacter versatilis Ellin345]